MFYVNLMTNKNHLLEIILHRELHCLLFPMGRSCFEEFYFCFELMICVEFINPKKCSIW